MSLPRRVGILVGRERSFPDALVEEVARRRAGVVAEYARIDIALADAPPAYDVLVDRISHEVPCYQAWLKLAAASGTHVVNNPFFRIADDKLFDVVLARRLGVAVPRTALLPQKAFGPDITEGSLTNLAFPLDWEGLVRELGFPMFVKPHWGGGFRDVTRVRSLEELWEAYDRSGQLTLIAQEEVRWTRYVRCIVVGMTEVLPAVWDPRLPHHERYVRAAASMPPLDEAIRERCIADARTLCTALGYEMNTVELAIGEDGVPVAIDFMNSAPDFDISSLGPETFRWVVEKMADLVIARALSPRRPLLGPAAASGEPSGAIATGTPGASAQARQELGR